MLFNPSMIAASQQTSSETTQIPMRPLTIFAHDRHEDMLLCLDVPGQWHMHDAVGSVIIGLPVKPPSPACDDHVGIFWVESLNAEEKACSPSCSFQRGRRQSS